MKRILLFIAVVMVCLATQLSAGIIGSFRVDAGPPWESPVPTAYTGQEVVALLFGGVPADYSLSISDTTITHTDWVSTSGGACSGGAFPCGTIAAENYKRSTGGLYAYAGDTAAYVTDWAIGPQYTNYVWSAAATPTPEPGVWGLIVTGLAMLGARRLRRS